jgi:Ca2+/Na+ antiporter
VFGVDVFSVLAYGQSLIMLVLTVVAGIAAVVALIHAAIQRPDAFPAVDRQSKVIWVAILAAASLFIWFFGAVSFLGIIGVVAMLVYLVDVRKRVDDIQGKSWFSKKA